jgi:hypothetical protein
MDVPCLELSSVPVELSQSPPALFTKYELDCIFWPLGQLGRSTRSPFLRSPKLRFLLHDPTISLRRVKELSLPLRPTPAFLTYSPPIISPQKEFLGSLRSKGRAGIPSKSTSYIRELLEDLLGKQARAKLPFPSFQSTRRQWRSVLISSVPLPALCGNQ